MSSPRRRVLVARLVAYGFIQAAATLAMALLVKSGITVLNTQAATPDITRLYAIAGLLLMVALVSAGLRRAEHVDAEKLGQGYVHYARLKLFHHLVRVGARDLTRVSRGVLMLRFIGDLSSLRQWVSLGMARLIVSGLTISLALAALAVIAPAVGLAVSASVLVAALLSGYIGPRLQRAARVARRQRGRLAARLNDRIANLSVIDAFGQAGREERNLRKFSNRLRRALIERARAAGWLRAVADGAASISQATALCVGVVVAASDGATIGSVVAAMVVAGLLAPRVRDLSRVFEYWTNARIAREKIATFLALPRRHAKTATTLKRRDAVGDLAFRNVSLGRAIRGIDARVRAGQRIAIVGPNGAGKTTLLMLAAGLLEPTAGRISLGRRDLAKVRTASRRRSFALVGPDFPLLRGSLRMNASYGAKVSDEEFKSVARMCGLDQLAHRLPRGYMTRISDGGANLSTGERASVALCRALVRDPKVLLLDEPESNFDPGALGALEKVRASFKGSILWVTHHRDWALRADQLWYLEGGRLIEHGKPQDLLSRDGPAARLFSPSIFEAA